MDTAKQQVVDRLKQANNILVTVSSNPSVDQLAACIGLTLLLNKFGKHGTAVFSGEVPSTLEFLEPEKTLEKTTDSLRDFIIALDRSKADKLRYKLENNVVRIFITPYRTSITEKDLQFSQGDFNVELVIALGVREQQDLDQAITAHGRILHDATVVSVNNGPGGQLGTIHWEATSASSLSEMVASLGKELDDKLLDNQIATALLTGIVAETDRFSNDKTTPTTMSLSAELMSAGANQQLVASKLQEKATPATEEKAAASPDQAAPEAPAQQSGTTAQSTAPETPKTEPGTLEITHDADKAAPAVDATAPEEAVTDSEHQIKVDEEGTISKLNGLEASTAAEQSQAPLLPEPQAMSPASSPPSRIVVDPPQLSGTLTANSRPEALDPSTDPLSATRSHPLLSRSAPSTVAPAPPVDTPPLPAAVPSTPLQEEPKNDGNTQQPPPTVIAPSSSSEVSTTEPALEASASPTQAAVDEARNAVEAAINASASADTLPPIQSLGSQPMIDLQPPQPPQQPPVADVLPPQTPPAVIEQPFDALTMPTPPPTFPPNATPPTGENPMTPPAPQSSQPTPPPVPPPMFPPAQ